VQGAPGTKGLGKTRDLDRYSGRRRPSQLKFDARCTPMFRRPVNPLKAVAACASAMPAETRPSVVDQEPSFVGAPAACPRALPVPPRLTSRDQSNGGELKWT
jgi:hypothetical protein